MRPTAKRGRAAEEFGRVSMLVMASLLAASCGGGGSGAVNGKPLAEDGVLRTNESEGSPGTLIATDPDGDPLIFEVLSQPRMGTVTLTGSTTGDFFFEPTPAEHGTDSFLFRACDPQTCSNIATMTIVITRLEVPPVASDDRVLTNVNTPVTVDVLLNDWSRDSDGLRIVSVTAGSNGTVTNIEGRYVTYMPFGGFVGVDSFTYEISDAKGGRDRATVYVTVNGPPVVSDVCASVRDDQPPNLTSFAVSLVASDPNGDDDIDQYVIESLPGVGTLGNCSALPCAVTSPILTYTPNATSTGRYGMDKFRYRARDTAGSESMPATVWILNEGAVRIMPLGDSITAGVTGFGVPPAGFRVGYRRKLYNDLAALLGSERVDFVGQRQDGQQATPPIEDPDHQGTPGQTAGQLASGVAGYLNAAPPDLILLHIGTNDFDTDPGDVRAILDNIDAWEASNYPVTIFLAKIIDDVPGGGSDLDVTSFNNNVVKMVAARIGDAVIVVDMEKGAGLDYGSAPPPSGDMQDFLHPKEDPDETDGVPVGYSKMADKWYRELTNPDNVGWRYLGLPQCE